MKLLLAQLQLISLSVYLGESGSDSTPAFLNKAFFCVSPGYCEFPVDYEINTKWPLNKISTELFAPVTIYESGSDSNIY